MKTDPFQSFRKGFRDSSSNEKNISSCGICLFHASLIMNLVLCAVWIQAEFWSWTKKKSSEWKCEAGVRSSWGGVPWVLFVVSASNEVAQRICGRLKLYQIMIKSTVSNMWDYMRASSLKKIWTDYFCGEWFLLFYSTQLWMVAAPWHQIDNDVLFFCFFFFFSYLHLVHLSCIVLRSSASFYLGFMKKKIM